MRQSISDPDSIVTAGGAVAQPEESPFAPGLTKSDVRRILTGVMLALFLAALDQTIVVTALPTIAAELSGGGLSWIVTAYILSATTTALLYGRFSDTHGRRPALLLGIALFTLGSVACAVAQTMPQLIAARALQGVGAGALVAIPMTVMGDMISPRARGKYQGYVATVYATSSLAGPALGGVIADYLHWSVIFWINVPLAALAVVIAVPLMGKLSRNQRHSPLDLVGAALVCVTTASFLLVLSWSGPEYGWLSPASFALLAVSIGGALLARWHFFRANAPLIPMNVLQSSVVSNAILSSFFGFGAFIGLCVMAPLYFELARGYSPTASGIAVIPLMVSTVIGALLAGQAMGRVRHYKQPPMAGLALAIVVSAFLAAAFPLLPDVVFSLFLGAISFGIGTTLPVITVAVQNAVPVHEMGVATASTSFFRQLGAALMVALFGALTVGSVELGVVAQDLDAILSGYRMVFAAAAVSAGSSLFFFSRMEELPLHTASS